MRAQNLSALKPANTLKATPGGPAAGALPNLNNSPDVLWPKACFIITNS